MYTHRVGRLPETLHHVLACTLRKALLALEDDNHPSLNNCTTVGLLLNHIPLAITRRLERSGSQKGAAKTK